MLHHVVNEHQWIGGECEHTELTTFPTDESGEEIPYFTKIEPAFAALQKIALDKRWMKSLKYYTNFWWVPLLCVYINITTRIRHMGMLESFHNVVLAYVTKRAAFQ